MWRVSFLRSDVIFHRTWAPNVEKAPKSLPTLRFGAFEVDFQAGELRRSGVRVRVQDQPFQVLTALLERPGQLITRDELRRRIWSTDTFVDFDQGLNKAMNRLREPSATPGLADSHLMLGIFGMRPPHDYCSKARAAAERALHLDETIAEAHNSLAAVRHLYDWNWPGAEQEFRRALELNPNYAVAHQWYASLLGGLGRHEEALTEVLLWARELDPLSLVINAFVGFVHMRARRYDQAIEVCAKAVELDPTNPFGHWILARSLDARHQLREALAQSGEAVRLSGNRSPYSAHLGYAYAKVGDSQRACEVLDHLRERSRTEYVSSYHFALIYTGLGESDLAFEWLEKAFEERTARLTGELSERVFDRLRSDSRFRDLVRRIGLPL
jgi:tetratricopeptide (TPR) repeat protein